MISSIDPHCPNAYSEDLRWRIVWQNQGLGLTHKEAALNVGVDRSTVSRTVKLFLTIGLVTKKKYPNEKNIPSANNSSSDANTTFYSRKTWHLFTRIEKKKKLLDFL